MAKISGANGQLYIGLTAATDVAVPVPYLSKFTFDANFDTYETTSFDDKTKTYVVGKSDAKGTYEGFYDTATSQMYNAATGGFASRTYLYPDHVNNPTTYFVGTAFFDTSYTVADNDAVKVTGSFSAATPFSKVN